MLYEYVCAHGTQETLSRPVRQRDAPVRCACCGEDMVRQWGMPTLYLGGLPGREDGVRYEDGSGLSTNTKLAQRANRE